MVIGGESAGGWWFINFSPMFFGVILIVSVALLGFGCWWAYQNALDAITTIRDWQHYKRELRTARSIMSVEVMNALDLYWADIEQMLLGRLGRTVTPQDNEDALVIYMVYGKYLLKEAMRGINLRFAATQVSLFKRLKGREAMLPDLVAFSRTYASEQNKLLAWLRELDFPERYLHVPYRDTLMPVG